MLLRGALTLSVLTGQAVRLTHIRARRTSPGLKLQHLRLIDVLARISGAAVDGAAIGSQSLGFEPRRALSHEPVIDIDTPGSLTLLLQSLLLPLSFSPLPTRLRLVGVTHAPRSPAFENIDWQWLPLLRQAGYRAEIGLERAGFAPKGGGVMQVSIQPVSAVEPLHLVERGRLLRISGCSLVACLDQSVAARQRLQLMSRLQGLNVPIDINSGAVSAPLPGAFIVLLAEFEQSKQSFFTLGELGHPPEVVANKAADSLIAHLHCEEGALDSHLASQLLLPLSFANGESALTTSSVSEQMLLTAELINDFLPATISIDAQSGKPGKMLVRGNGAPRIFASKADLGFVTMPPIPFDCAFQGSALGI
ncbi:hypothetical protein AT959_00405 [Dechloromonas denitrificans]|uniref:RNA 3'-terminal-phosphate cyclase (ATP) n=1 Tax=Dechloromonas denitrificans TaxID=281362 RepID=A0A133XP33_9RHOO|nr:hypothetical protein AT959_00405 [Dechloromonas denitrificans]